MKLKVLLLPLALLKTKEASRLNPALCVAEQVISLQLNSPWLVPGSRLEVRVKVTQTDLSPFTGLVTLQLFSPAGHLVTEVRRRTGGSGPALEYQALTHTLVVVIGRLDQTFGVPFLTECIFFSATDVDVYPLSLLPPPR